jgi:hypothetical protein
MTPDKPPTGPPPLVKEPPKDDPSGAPRPNDDVKEPHPDPKKITSKPKEDVSDDDDDDLPNDMKDLDSF